MVANNHNLLAHASPTKSFFVSMITRDITLEDSILDLIDNSVDRAWKNEGSPLMSLSDDTDLSKYQISVSVKPDRFSIKDNCGGMTLDDAKKYAFSFGRRPEEQFDKYSIGVYGIGMKRAVFKLGRNIRVKSTYQDNSEKHAFTVLIPVEQWLEDEEWNFSITRESQELDQNGVEIIIEQLTDSARLDFSTVPFIHNLRRAIARDYSLHLNRGLKISVNDKIVEGVPLKFIQNSKYAPAHISYEHEDIVNSEMVTVEIIGGMVAPPTEDTSIQGRDEEAINRRSGWYVACNGRIVLAADKTSISGWGSDGWPLWHPQYSGFMGIVFFTASNAVALPITTTKRNVDVSSEVYLRAKPHMREISRKWISYTNTRKQALEEAKQKEQEAARRSILFHEVKKQSSITFPQLVPVPRVKRANVSYSVPLSKLQDLARELGNVNMKYREVGLKSFDHTYNDYVGEE